MKNAMTYKGYAARIEFDAQDRVFFGRLAGIQDIVTFHGETVDELEAAFKESVDHYLAACAKLGDEPNKPYSGKLTLRIPPNVHAAIATAAWLGRGVVWPVLDSLAASSLGGLAGWHAGCVVRDSCLGTPSDLPWALAQGGSSVTRHPVEIYAAMLLALAAAVIAVWRARGRPRLGTPAGAALTAAAGVRLITEPLRPSLGSGPAWWYIAGMIAGLAILGWSILRTADEQGASAADHEVRDTK